MSATITYGSYVFSTTGTPLISRKEKYLAAEPGMPPQRREVTLAIAQKFTEPSFADNEARYRALLAALETTEDVLVIQDENEYTCLNRRVRVVETDRPKQWGQWMLDVTVVFTFIEDLSDDNATDASFTPTGGSAIALPNVVRLSEDIRTTRFNPRVPNRRETIGSVLITGEQTADPALTPADRRTALLTLKATIDAAADCKEGSLVFAGFSKTVRVEQLSCSIGDGTDKLTWTLTGTYQRFPSGSHAEAEFKVSTRNGRTNSEKIVSVTGTIRANSRSAADTKLAAIKSTYNTAGRMLLNESTDDDEVSGTDGDTFLVLGFSLEFREVLSVTSYTLSVATRTDNRANRQLITYSGRVTAASLGAAETKARLLGNGAYPIQLSSNETANVLSVDGATEQLIELTFQYEYSVLGSAIWAEVSLETDRPTFGNATYTVSGFVVADTQSNALTFARSLKPNYLARTNKETPEVVHYDPGSGDRTQFQKVTFSYSFHLENTDGSISYEVRESENFDTREKTVTYSGTAWADTEAAADALIEALVELPMGGRHVTDERSSKFDESGAFSEFMFRTFNVSFIVPLTAGSDDVLEAQWQLEKVFSIDKAVLTPIPYGTAHVQENVGTTIGTATVSGYMVALNSATAESFANGKLSALPAGGYELEGARRKTSGTMMYPHGTTAKAYRTDFSFTKHYPNLTFS